MGDRGNIKIQYEETGLSGSGGAVFFYTHWRGGELPVILKAALIRGRDRHGDESYLARIIFSEMIKDDIDGETGYGIAPHMIDNQRPLLTVYMEGQRVELSDTDDPDGDKQNWSFEEFIENGPDDFYTDLDDDPDLEASDLDHADEPDTD